MRSIVLRAALRRPRVSARALRRAARLALLAAVAASPLLAPARALAQPAGTPAAPASPRQTPAAAPTVDSAGVMVGAVRVFYDCQARGCDDQFVRTELPWVAWVRDRMLADVHLLVSTLRAGNGGTEYTITVLGVGKNAGRVDTLRHTSLPNDADDRIRRDLVRLYGVGLARYAVATPVGRRLAVSFAGGGTNRQASPQSLRDPWNAWIFRVGLNGNGLAEQRQQDYSVGGSLAANRIVARSRVTLGVEGSYREQDFTLRDGSRSVNVLRAYGGSALVVRALDDHWSIGGKANANASDFLNEDLAARVAPAVEWNLFPWAEATRRQLTLLYSLGVSHYDFQQITIYDRTRQTNPDHQLIVATSARQPWGSVNVTATGTQFLNEPRFYNLRIGGFVGLRIAKGLQIDVGGNAERVRDQIFLARAGLTDDQILARQRALATGYRVQGFLRASYTFGSIYNTVVNPRFESLGSSGGRGRFFFDG